MSEHRAPGDKRLRAVPRRVKPKSVEVSNHAMLLWLERSGVVDIEAMRTALSAALDRAVAASAAIGGGECLILSNGLVYVVRDNVLVTVVPDDGRHKHARNFTHHANRPADGSA